MHVVLAHDALIPPKTYGGTERVIAWLARGLRELGHNVTLIVREGSRVDDIPITRFRRGSALTELLPRDADVVHLWTTPVVPPKIPFVVTIEGNGQPGERFHPNTLFISRSHASNHGARHFVYNGVDPSDYHCAKKRENYAVFLAKASWRVKNLEGAIAIARASGVRLEVLGSRDWPLGLQRVLPRVRGVRYHGMVDDDVKRELLSRASALLFPVRWNEPFGIAVVEALASGCPVLGTPYGALPEIVTPDVGFLSDNGTLLSQVLGDIGRFSPERCRASIFGRFDHLTMAREYLGYYERVIATGSIDRPSELARPVPVAMGSAASALLPWTAP